MQVIHPKIHYWINVLWRGDDITYVIKASHSYYISTYPRIKQVKIPIPIFKNKYRYVSQKFYRHCSMVKWSGIIELFSLDRSCIQDKREHSVCSRRVLSDKITGIQALDMLFINNLPCTVLRFVKRHVNADSEAPCMRYPRDVRDTRRQTCVFHVMNQTRS